MLVGLEKRETIAQTNRSHDLGIFQRHAISKRHNLHHQNSSDTIKVQSTSDNTTRLRLPGHRAAGELAEESPAAYCLDAMETPSSHNRRPRAAGFCV